MHALWVQMVDRFIEQLKILTETNQRDRTRSAHAAIDFGFAEDAVTKLLDDKTLRIVMESTKKVHEETRVGEAIRTNWSKIPGFRRPELVRRLKELNWMPPCK